MGGASGVTVAGPQKFLTRERNALTWPVVARHIFRILSPERGPPEPRSPQLVRSTCQEPSAAAGR